MDYYESGFEPDNNDFSSNYSYDAVSKNGSTTARLDVRPRSNVVPFPLITQRNDQPENNTASGPNDAFAPHTGDDLWARDVFLICPSGSNATSMLTELSDSMQSLTILNQFRSALQLAARCDGSETLLAVDLDMIPDLDGTIADLAKLRHANSTLAILIMSRSFVETDLHPHHSYIADASLRLPASKYETSVALHFAVTNAFFRTCYDDGA
ncbi:hypothetical protein [uncultured Tateyamaria sp.]|uniref:hypothetical protein n=1 Tax=uncultured Tateyamaria sp. TaxID=455651 RepID=UPI002632B709|nr:hypothetical protein [uncultured Tateyamaria sp.]